MFSLFDLKSIHTKIPSSVERKKQAGERRKEKTQYKDIHRQTELSIQSVNQISILRKIIFSSLRYSFEKKNREEEGEETHHTAMIIFLLPSTIKGDTGPYQTVPVDSSTAMLSFIMNTCIFLFFFLFPQAFGTVFT